MKQSVDKFKNAFDLLNTKQIVVLNCGTLESLIGIKKADKRMVQSGIEIIKEKRKQELAKVIKYILT